VKVAGVGEGDRLTKEGDDSSLCVFRVIALSP
jgi:hypothetical protein